MREANSRIFGSQNRQWYNVFLSVDVKEYIATYREMPFSERVVVPGI
jgi:hypothetical protein